MAEVSIITNGCYGGFHVSKEGICWLYKNHPELPMFDTVDDINEWSLYNHIEELRVCPELIRAIEAGVDNINFGANLCIETMPKVYYENGFYEIEEYDGLESLSLNIHAAELLVRNELFELSATKNTEEGTTVISCLQHIIYADHGGNTLELLRLLIPPSADCTISKLAENVQYLPGIGKLFKEGEEEFNKMKHV